MTRWAMVIDLGKCIGCGTCCEVCAQLNNVSFEASWRKLIERTVENEGIAARLFLTMSCMHCDDPSCLAVCPTRATYQHPDGIVAIDQALCVGCGACVLACPYRARAINPVARMHCYEKSYKNEKSVGIQDNIGVCTKCDFCRAVIENGVRKGLNPGRDPEATPKCVRNCPSEALVFGDRGDPASEVSVILNQKKTIRLLEELGTDPAVYYIPDDEIK